MTKKKLLGLGIRLPLTGLSEPLYKMGMIPTHSSSTDCYIPGRVLVH